MLFRAANSDVLVVETDGRTEQTAGIGTACPPIPWTLGLNCPDLELQMSNFKSPLFPTAPLPFARSNCFRWLSRFVIFVDKPVMRAS